MDDEKLADYLIRGELVLAPEFEGVVAVEGRMVAGKIASVLLVQPSGYACRTPREES